MGYTGLVSENCLVQGKPPMPKLVSGVHPDTPAWFPSPGSTQVSLSIALTTSRMPDILPDPAQASASLSGLPQQLRCESAIFCGSVTQSCLTPCDPMDCSTPGFPVHHHLPELAQTQVHQAVLPSNTRVRVIFNMVLFKMSIPNFF